MELQSLELLELTPWIRVLLEKLTVIQLVKEFSDLYRTRKFITVFTTAPRVPVLSQINPANGGVNHIKTSTHVTR
jgi:hypothetical protein